MTLQWMCSVCVYNTHCVVQFAVDYSQNKAVTLKRLCEIIHWPQSSPLTTFRLAMFERMYEAVDLYLWLW